MFLKATEKDIGAGPAFMMPSTPPKKTAMP